MTIEMFNLLVDLLLPNINVNEEQSRRSTGGNDPITLDIVVVCGLEFLGNGMRYHAIAFWYGISPSSARRIILKFCRAVILCEKLAIKLPETPEELKSTADEWDKVSGANSIYYGVVGAIDGWLACTNKPTIGNDADYFSGHYQRFGLNVQAVCDGIEDLKVEKWFKIFTSKS